ncbi:MAG: chlorite dismutase [Dehalococcoidia bacterium]|nr:chlorite dismutase [Dehalococcoidia bacterium]
MTTAERPAASPHQIHAPASEPDGATARTPRGVQSVKFSFFRLSAEARRLPGDQRAALGEALSGLLSASTDRMLTRVYTTAGTRSDTDFLVWQVHDDLAIISDWHAEFDRSNAGAWLERPHSYLSMTMRSQYTNTEHASAERRERLRADGGVDAYLFVYPMAKTKAWYQLPQEERQRMMDEHIAIGHKYHGIKINTTYSYGLDDQEFVVAFEGDDPGEFLALVRELRGTDSTQYTAFDTPMFTCRRIEADALAAHLGLT